MRSIIDFTDWVRSHGLFPATPTLSSPHAPEVMVDGRKVLLFASNNYLGMMKDPRVIEAAEVGLRRWGIGNGSARLLTGNLEIHAELERSTADFKDKEACLSFVTGYMANVGALPALGAIYKTDIISILAGKTEKNRDTIFFSDQFNHASIIDGIRLSGCPKEIYAHRNVDDLEEQLKRYSKKQRKIIVTDGIFSMDGDMAPLPDIVALAKKYNAMVYLDDAHATGIFGKHGRGLEDHFNIEGSVDVVMGTYTKAFGGVGGFITGTQKLIDYLKITAGSFIFTAPIAPPVVCGLIKAVELVGKETWRRETLIANANYLRGQLSNIGVNFMNSQSQIIPIFIGEEKKAIRATELLLERGIFVPTARWPAVPKGTARLRVTVSCEHTREHIDTFVGALKEVKHHVGF